ncbi:MAG: hypothetical protein ACRCT6_06465, partial [Notoacmeibacter sp.]
MELVLRPLFKQKNQNAASQTDSSEAAQINFTRPATARSTKAKRHGIDLQKSSFGFSGSTASFFIAYG